MVSSRRFLMAYGPLRKSPISSNLTRSATQSSAFAFSAEISKLPRMFANFVRLEGTGESQFRSAAAD